MWWKIAKVFALIGAIGVTILFLALLVMVTRPAIISGVSGSYLAHSLADGDNSNDGGSCREMDGGRWTCRVHGPGANGTYRVDVNWMGCWDAEPVDPSAASAGSAEPADRPARNGCIQLGDIITFD